MLTRKPWRAAASALAVVVIAAGCSGGSDDDDPAPTALATFEGVTATPTVTATSAPASPTAARSATAEATPTTAPTTAPTAVPTAASQPTAPPPQPTSPPRPASVTLRFRASNISFDQTLVRAPAGASVTAIMQNDDAGIEHNLSFSLPGLPHGNTCKGPCTTTQVFTPSTPGSYFFLCTLHDMSGTFIVDP